MNQPLKCAHAGNNAVLAKISNDIKERSCSVIGVFDAHPTFSYSIGLNESLNVPDIIIFGLDPRISTQFINDVVTWIKEHGPLTACERYSDFAEGFETIFIECDQAAKEEYTCKASLFYGHNRYKLLQMVWPDPKGLFPWEKGFAEKFVKLQPLVGQV
jgi:hypothetical protein